jgi:hypothetical protein
MKSIRSEKNIAQTVALDDLVLDDLKRRNQ